MLRLGCILLLLLVPPAVGDDVISPKPSSSTTTCTAGENVVSLFCREGVCMPRLFILGAAKSSTTSLWSLMRWQFGNMCSPVALEGDPKWFRKEGTFFNVNEHFDSTTDTMIKQDGLLR
jgi:hypothetical protein